MGLDELIPDDAETTSSSGSRNRQTSSEDEPHISIGSGNLEKSFSEDKWEKVKKVIRNETEYTVNKVKNLPAQKRYDVLHECALKATGESGSLPDDYRSEVICHECDNDCSSGYVELEGRKFCVQHTAGQIAVSLGKSVQDNL